MTGGMEGRKEGREGGWMRAKEGGELEGEKVGREEGGKRKKMMERKCKVRMRGNEEERMKLMEKMESRRRR